MYNFLKISTYSIVVSWVFLAAVFAAPVRQLREVQEMDFATLIPDANGDTIILTPQGNISGAGLSFFSGSARAAQFSARGDANAAVSISFSSGDILTGSGAAMSLGAFSHDAGVTPAFNAAQQIVINIGATLSVGSGQISGAYSGTYTIFVDYP